MQVQVTKYPSLEEILNLPESKILKEKPAQVISVKHDDKELIYKSLERDYNEIQPNSTVARTLLKPFKYIDSLIRKTIDENTPLRRYREYQSDNGEHLIYTLTRWNELGVPTSKILEVQDNTIILEKVGEKSIKEYLQEDNTIPYYSFLQTIKKIKQVALETKDVNLFHTDSHLDNYIYNKKDGRTYAIDPEVVYKEKTPFHIGQAVMNLSILYSLDEIESQHKQHYFNIFVNTLTQEEKEQMISLNQAVPKKILYLQQFRENIVSRIKGRSTQEFKNKYSKKRVHRLNKILSS